jgi:2-polyprenyl-6-hydroxyphenyl methylase / 3-demethylubiquinone-9 3-methyltransferase
MVALFFILVGLQGLAMIIDEVCFHRRRELPRWERIGHPLDTLTIVACLTWLLATAPSERSLAIYVGLAVAGTLFVTKDEWVHARLCSAGEQWLHACLFILHPCVLAVFAIAWWRQHDALLVGQVVIVSAFMVYQVVYWNIVEPRRHQRRAVNNAWYADLGARWYAADDTPIALLRAESRHRNPWIAEQITLHLGRGEQRVLDLGCGAGFLANALGERGHRVTGIDTTADNLLVARHHDRSRSISYEVGDACALTFGARSFDVVCAMDLLEHVEQPERVIGEASRVLEPGGLLFFHTFNRNWLANLIVIKGVELFVKNTPKDLHVLRLFLTPDEVMAMLRAHDLELVELRGSRPRFRWPLWRMLLTGRVGDDFAFTFTSSTRLGYTGIARKRRDAASMPTPATRSGDPERQTERFVARAHGSVRVPR